MTSVVNDTGPVNYLVQIGHADLSPDLFGTVCVPESVLRELSLPKSPSALTSWIETRPSWLAVEPSPSIGARDSSHLHVGERDAILVSTALKAELLLMDDRRGVVAARSAGLRVTETPGVLDAAVDRGLIDWAEAIRRLRSTNFRVRPDLLDRIVARHRTGRF